MPAGTVRWLYATSIKKLRRTLATLVSLVLVFGCGFAYELSNFLRAPGETPGDMGISSVPPEAAAPSPWLFAFLVLLLLSGAACALFLKFYDRIPAERLTGRGK